MEKRYVGIWKDFFSGRCRQPKKYHKIMSKIDEIIQKHYIKNARTLDCGVSDGRHSKNLVGEKYGIDIVPLAKKVCEKLGIKFIQRDLNYNLPFKSNFFENVLCIETLEHLYNWREFLKESYRVLKKDGVFIVTAPYHGLIKNLLIIFLNFDKHFSDNPDYHLVFFTEKGLKKWLIKTGFKIQKVYKIGGFYPIYSLMVLVCKKHII